MKFDKKSALSMGAGLAVLASLGTGVTLAAWNDTASTDGGTIKAGTLDVNPAGSMTWARAATPTTPVDISTYKIVPNDALVGSQKVHVTLQGDHLSAKFGVAQKAGSTNDLNATITYTVKKADGTVLIADTPIGTPASADLPSPGANNTTNEDYTVEVKAAFPDVTGQTGVTQTSVLSGLDVTVQQGALTS